MEIKDIKEKILKALEDEETCALMGCKLEPYALSLGEIIYLLKHDEDFYGQAYLLIKLGFKPEDKFCPECFWK